jgi:hypothetical protein
LLAVQPDLTDLETALFPPTQQEHMRVSAEYQDLTIRLHWRKVEADRLLREALAGRMLVAYIRNPISNEKEDVGYYEEWLISPLDEYEPGFRDDYVRPMPEQPGPPTNFDDGLLRRVFIKRTELEDWLTATQWDQIVAETEVTTPKQKHMRLALLDEWPSGRVPRLSIPEIVGRITESYRSRMKRAGITDGPPTDSTVRRLIGREKKSDK